MTRLGCVLFTIALVALPRAVPAAGVVQPVPSERSCAELSDEHWTMQERFVWEAVCRGDVANFMTEPLDGVVRELNRSARREFPNSEIIPDNRVIRSSFLEAILLKDQYRRLLTRNGVRIVGARFTELIDLSNADLGNVISLEECILEKGANLSAIHSTKMIDFDKSIAPLSLNFDRARVDDDISMNRADISGISALGAHVGGNVSLIGTRVRGTLDMDSIRIDGSLLMRHGAETSAEFAEIRLRNAHIGGNVSLIGSSVTGRLDMDALQIGGSLFMRQGARNPATFGAVVLTGARVGGQLDLSGSQVAGALNMDAIQIDESLLMREIPDTSDASVPGSLMNFDRVAASGTDEETADVTQPNDMQPNDKNLGAERPASDPHEIDERGTRHLIPEFRKVTFDGARILGDLDLSNARVYEDLSGRDLAVSRVVDLSKGQFVGSVRFEFCRIGRLRMDDGIFHKLVSLIGTQINGELSLGTQESGMRWGTKPTTLNLLNASADAIQDFDNVWPDKLELTGFTYRKLGGSRTSGAAASGSMAFRSVEWLTTWLEKTRYSPQPYEQLAAALRVQGRLDAGDEILFAGRERERREASSGLQYLWLTTQMLLIGYGYRIYRAVGWFLLLLALGALVESSQDRPPKDGARGCWMCIRTFVAGWKIPLKEDLHCAAATLRYLLRIFVYSFEMMLPLVRLRGDTKEHPQGLVNLYFHLHGLAAIVLGGFLAAGLAGLTK